jgi:SagB-type dehydrogenase family enzyme
LRARGKTKKSGTTALNLYARLCGPVALEVRPSGEVVASFGGNLVGLGKFSAEAAAQAQDLRAGLVLSTLAGDSSRNKELLLLIGRLAKRGLLEYRLARSQSGSDAVIIEPQTPDYWPRVAEFRATDVLVLSRFAYLRRRADDMVLESPRAGALFSLCDPAIASALALLSVPRQIKWLRRQAGFPANELLALLVDCHILFKVDTAHGDGQRAGEGDDNLVLWDFHDLVFHTRSTEGRHANPLGGTYPYVDVMPSPPAIRPSWPGEKIDLGKFTAPAPVPPPVGQLLRARHSVRDFDSARPVTLAELAQFLDCTARVLSSMTAPLDPEGGGPMLTYTVRPFPSAGGSYELELYLAVDKCEGLPSGFYHYDAGSHALAPIDTARRNVEAQLAAAQFAMGAAAVPQIVITIAARFGRVSWKYSSIAYALILKDAGVLLQTFYLTATDMGLGGCAIGTMNIDLFAKMTGLDVHVEGPVGQFALGRGAAPQPGA